MEWEPVASGPREALFLPAHWSEHVPLVLATLWLVLAALAILLSR